MGERWTITKGPVAGGSYKSLREAVQRQVNNVHVKHPMAKHHHNRDDNIIFSKQDAREVKQPYDNPLIIMLTIEGYNTWRVLVDNGSSADVIYMMSF